MRLLWVLASIGTSVAIIVVTLANPRSSRKSLPYLIASMVLLTLTTYALTQLVLLVGSGICRPYLGGTELFSTDYCSIYTLLISTLVGINVPASTYFLVIATKYFRSD